MTRFILQMKNDPRSCERNLEAWKNSGLQTRDLVIPVRYSNQLSYKTSDDGCYLIHIIVQLLSSVASSVD